jgi:hypothetical protein
MDDQQIIARAIRECETGFSAHSRDGYERITELLSSLSAPTAQTEKAARLAEAGPTLSSPRFAYPHIKDALMQSQPVGAR